MLQDLAPNLTKGILVTAPILSSLLPPRVVVFQYNPTELTREISPNYDENDNRTLGFTGPATETISLTAIFDATEDLIKGGVSGIVAETLGIFGQLSSLQLMVYPSVANSVKNALEAAAGTIEISAADVPLTVFAWGIKRIVPVKLTSMTITEQAFDSALNPIRAQVAISMQVLSDNDVKATSSEYALYLAHQTAQEVMATAGTTKSIVQLPSVVSSLI